MEERFTRPLGLDWLTSRDLNANSVADAFDFNQSPLPPISLTKRSCSPVATTSVTFPPAQPGKVGVTRSILIANYDTQKSLSFTSFNLSGADFSVTNTCTAPLPPNPGRPFFCNANVTFKPTGLGTRTGTLTITDSDETSPQTVLLSGIGSNLVVSPSLLNFGTAQVGSTTSKLNATLTNGGTTAVTLNAISPSGDFSPTTTCPVPGTLNPGASCTLSATFSPTTPGSRYGSMTVSSTDPASPTVLNLTGEGTNVTLTGGLNFSAQPVGTTSTPQTATLTNQGSNTITINKIWTVSTVVPPIGKRVILPQPSAEFAQTNDCGTNLGQGQSCTITVTFTPNTTGTRAAQVQVETDQADSPNLVVLTGNGAPALTHAEPYINQPLVPSAVAPGAGSFALKVNGFNFISGATVNWNGAPLSTTFVNDDQLSATVPAANVTSAKTALITVTNPSPGGGTSNAALFHVVTSLTSITLTKNDFAVGQNPRWVTAADFNGDQKLDLAVANFNANTVSIFTGVGDGTFTLKTTLNVGAGPISIAAADINADGKLDLAVANQTENDVSIFIGNGDGTFTPMPGSLFQTVQPTWISAADFNADGTIDLAIANNIDPTVSIFLGLGDDTFYPTPSPPVGRAGPISIGVADFNGDGIADFSELNSTDRSVSTALGVGNGTFTAATNRPAVGRGPSSMVTADLNNDGKMDLALTNKTDNTISVLLGVGDGTFLANPNLTTANGPQFIVAGDFNGDNKIDLASINQTANSMSLFLGNGDGTFKAKADFQTGASPAAGAVGDFNNDGFLDLAVADSSANNISIMKQGGGGGGPIVSFTPTSLAFSVVVVGQNSAPKNVTMKNTGNGVLNITSITSTTTDYTQTNNCGSSLNPGASCTISVTFAPGSAGLLNGTISVTDNAPGSPQTVPLSGRGTFLRIAPGTLNFPNTPVGQTSAPMQVRMINLGTTPIAISFQITGTNAGDFAIANTTCGPSLAAGAQCQIRVTFKPLQTGARSAAVSINDGSSGGIQKVNLGGSGT
jgi:hypothetical protein